MNLQVFIVNLLRLINCSINKYDVKADTKLTLNAFNGNTNTFSQKIFDCQIIDILLNFIKLKEYQ